MTASLQARTLVNAAQRAWYRYGSVDELYLCRSEDEQAERKRVGDAAMEAERALLAYIARTETGSAAAPAVTAHPTDEAEHAALGASGASRWMACPGSNRLIAESDLSPRPPSAHALEGIAAHAVAEMALRSGKDPEMWLGATIKDIVVTDAMVKAVRVYTAFCTTLEAAGRWEIERRFDLAPLDPPGPMFGTADFVAYAEDGKTLRVVDFKYGEGVVVEIANNPQLRYYALGALLSLPRGTTVDAVEITIVQPRAQHSAGPIRTERITLEELSAFGDALLASARATLAPDAPLRAGDQCRWCPASRVCPARPRYTPPPSRLSTLAAERASRHAASTIGASV